MATSIKVQRPSRLTEDETLTSFEDWRNNLIFYLNQDKKFKPFLETNKVWKKTAEEVDHRGLTDATEHLNLINFLGVIASLSPPLLHGDLIDDTTKFADIFKLLRSYYQFAPSEATFMKFSEIKRELINGTLERPIHLYLRMRQFVRDNLLLSTGKIQFDGKIPTKDEVFSPTTERFIVLRWLELLHPLLPNHISKVFAHDLQTRSLKDLQPRISEQIDDLLRQIQDKDDKLEASLAYSKVRYHPRSYNYPRNGRENFNTRQFESGNHNSNYPPKKHFTQHTKKNTIQKCEACRSVGEPFIGHTTYTCPNIAPNDRSNTLKSLSLEVDEESFHPEYFENSVEEDISQVTMETDVKVDRVNIRPSPRFNVKIRNTCVTMLLDTGATGSMISLDFCKMIGLQVYPSVHSAIQADGNSSLDVVGEVHTSILMDNRLKLTLNAVVVS